MAFGGFLLLLTLLGVAYRVYFMRQRQDAYQGPHLHDRLRGLFEAYDGAQLSQAELRVLELQADTAFRDILTGVGLIPTGWTVRVHGDDVLGPVPEICGPDRQVLGIAEFEHGLREGRIELPSVNDPFHQRA